MAGSLKNDLIAKKLTCVRGGKKLFSDLSFQVQPSKALIISGANGSGKTSLIRILAGLLSLQMGTVAWQGEEGDPATLLNGDIHYLGHAEALKPYLTVKENLGIWGRLNGDDAGVDSATRETGIFQLQDHPIKFLSEGQKKRVNLARLLTAQKPIWLLDEPASGLDKDGQKLLRKLIARQLKSGGFVITATHQDLGIKNANHLKLGNG